MSDQEKALHGAPPAWRRVPQAVARAATIPAPGAAPLQGNPLLELHRRTEGRLDPRGADLETLIARYGFAVPSTEALQVIARAAPAGLVEVGAGTGYWARLLSDSGVDVVAYDLFPPPSSANRWFAGSHTWFPVAAADETVVTHYGERALLLVWPTRKEAWAARAAQLYHAVGGHRLLFVGEKAGGRTGDDAFHAMLGGFDRCWTCAYGIADAPCICDIQPLWQLMASVTLPHWEGLEDNLYVYERLEGPPEACSSRRLRETP